MSKSIRLADQQGENIYWDTSSVTHNQQSLKTYLNDRNFARRITTNGARNYWYYLGKVRKVTSGSGNVGRIVYFFNNWENYNQSVPAIVTLTKGKINICVLGEPMSISPNWKYVYEYEDADYYYFYLWTPNYHDAWQSWVLEEYAAEMSEVGSRYSDADFSTLVTNKGLSLLRYASTPQNYNSNDCYIHLYWSSDTGYNAGGSVVQGLTTAFAKNATYSGNTITIPVDGLYSIECHYHMLDRTYRTFMTLSFRNAGSLGPDNYRTGDDQGIGTHATDPLVATHFTAYLAAGTTISLEIYFAANTALQGGKWNSFIDIKKIGPYPNT